MPTETDKQRAIEALRALPENATIEEAIEQLCFIAKVQEGLRQSEAGRVVDHEQVKERFHILTVHHSARGLPEIR